MDYKPKNREWVKNAAIIFLVVLLILTFFSNTIRNHTLPEVATKYVESGTITAKVRGTGTVSANGTHQVKADQTREIRAVMVKTGQEVEAGDVLFVLGAGDSEELEQAQDALRQLQTSYQKAAVSIPEVDYTLDERRIQRAQEQRDAAKDALDAATAALGGVSGATAAEIKAAKEDLEDAQKLYDEKCEKAHAEEGEAQDAVDEAWEELQYALANPDPMPPQAAVSASENDITGKTVPPPLSDHRGTEGGETGSTPFPDEPENVKQARKKLSDAKLRLDEIRIMNSGDIALAKENLDRRREKLDRLLSAGSPEKEDYDKALADYNAAEDNLLTAQKELELKKQTDEKNSQLAYIDLSDIAAQMEKQKEKIKELSGGEENTITATVPGTIQTVDCTSGDTKLKDELLCTIEVPDMGYNMSFSVTNDQARRLRPGDSATVSNYYWGSEIVATLSTIRVDPKNPQSNKILTFDIEGDVNTGSELTISVGQKSANYDVIIPNSSIRTDTNGSFVLKIEAKNSPLGNRYIARRVSVEVLAADDINSAVTGDLTYGDYVITTSNAPVKAGDQVRMAES